MRPVTHEPRLGWEEVVFAKNQPEYIPLPVLRKESRDTSGELRTKWALSWRERLRVMLKGSVYLSILTCGHPLQPLKIAAAPIDD